MNSDEPKLETNSGVPEDAAAPPPADNAVEAVRRGGGNEFFRRMMDRNFLEYASYVVKDRAIPDVDDGLKPVQRRILWALYRADDGRTHKAANIIGNTMHFHPHGDQSIGDALVVLANKEYYITKQGNFGNILTGSPAAAPRYIECSLSPLGREVLFDNDITEFVDSYDGRNLEPVRLPVKIPSLLMLGSDGIAVGMATKIMPHNFVELLQAQIAILRNEPFEVLPDFLQGGLMDAGEYADGNGKIVLRARIERDDKHRRLIIREIPATCTTESLIASIERAAEKNKIKISSVNDYTAEHVEIEVVPTRGYDLEKTMQALYMYTDCATSITVNMTVIRENRPCQMTVSEVLRRNTGKLLEYLKRELEIELGKQEELFHAKTLAQLFFENRIYKRIEECKSEKEEYAEVHSGLAPFRNQLRRDVTDADIDKLLAHPVRRIARFDIEKNQRELAEVLERIAEIQKHLAHLKKYAVGYLEDLLKKYGSQYPRRTEIERFEKIDRQVAALNNIKIGWDRKAGYVGTSIKSDDTVTCNEFDKFLCVEKTGKYRIIGLPPEKLFVGKLYEFRKQDTATRYAVIYREGKTNKLYGKRTRIDKFILDREYPLCPDGCKLELLTPRPDALYDLVLEQSRGHMKTVTVNLMELPERSSKARGVLLSTGTGQLRKVAQQRYLTAEELAPFIAAQAAEPEPDSDLETDPETPEPVVEPAPEPVVESEPEPVVESEPEPVVEPAPEPAVEPAPEPVVEPVVEPAPEPVVEPVVEPAPEPVVEPAPEPVAEPAKSLDELIQEVPIESVPPTHREKTSPAKKTGEDDDFGIVQPEFGF